MPTWANGRKRLTISIKPFPSNNIGGVYSKLGDKQKALEFYQKAADLFYQIDDKWHEVTVRKNIALLLALQSKLDEAAAEVATTIKLAEAINHPDLEKLRVLQQRIEQMGNGKAQK
jgi:tetratricopeptide (TPR) repeat protein